MCGAIRHRGPDDEGVLSMPERPSGGPLAVIGNRRLSIIDVAGGHQPIANEDRHDLDGRSERRDLQLPGSCATRLEARAIACDHARDTECLVHLYEELGDAFVRELEGMFALAFWDDRRKKLVLARDRFGKKPLLYAEDGGRLGSDPSSRRSSPTPSIERDARSRRARRVPRVHVGAGAADHLQADPQAAAGARACPRRGRHARLALLVAVVYAQAAHQRGGSDCGAAAAADRGGAQASDQRSAAWRVPERRRGLERGRRDHGRTAARRRSRRSRSASTRRATTSCRMPAGSPSATAASTTSSRCGRTRSTSLPTLVRHYGEPYADSSAIPSYYLPSSRAGT